MYFLGCNYPLVLNMELYFTKIWGYLPQTNTTKWSANSNKRVAAAGKGKGFQTKNVFSQRKDMFWGAAFRKLQPENHILSKSLITRVAGLWYHEAYG